MSDERLRQTHELVTGIKLVKLHAWEDVFIRRVTSTRERELHLLYRDSIYRALMSEYGRRGRVREWKEGWRSGRNAWFLI